MYRGWSGDGAAAAGRFVSLAKRADAGRFVRYLLFCHRQAGRLQDRTDLLLF